MTSLVCGMITSQSSFNVRFHDLFSLIKFSKIPRAFEPVDTFREYFLVDDLNGALLFCFSLSEIVVITVLARFFSVTPLLIKELSLESIPVRNLTKSLFVGVKTTPSLMIFLNSLRF